MEARHIRAILSAADKMTKPLFRGIFTADELKNMKKKKNSIYVIFSGAKGGGLGHWMSIQIDENDQIYFLDSLSGNPENYSEKLSNFLGNDYWCLPFRLQSSLSSYCGMFVCFFAYFMARKVYPPKLVHLFVENNSLQNDCFIRHWWRCRYSRIISLNRSPIATREQRSVSYETYLKAVALNTV